MSFIIAIFIILLLSISISYIFQKKFEYTLPLVMAGISLTLYIASFFNIRQAGIWAVVLLFLIASAASLYIRRKTGRKIKESLKSSGIIYILLIIIAVCIIARGFVFSTSNWDEYSHWALVLKNLFLSNNFGNLSDSTVLFKYYPQGISLFQNFTTSFSNSFSESNTLAGILILSYAQLITIFSNIKYTDWKKIVVITCLIFITPLVFFDTFFSTIGVDAVMALIFVNIMFFNYSYNKKDLFYAIYMCLQFYLLVNTKQIGIILALVAFITILTDLIVTNKIHTLRTFFKNTKKELIITLAPLFMGIITYVSWKIYIAQNKIAEGFTSPSMADVVNIFSPNAPYYFHTTVTNFIHHLLEQKQYGIYYFSFILWSIFLLITLYSIYKLRTDIKQRSFLVQFSMFAGLCAYIIVLLVMYLVAFTEYESTIVASFDRYVGTYFLSLFAFTILIVIDYIIKSKSNNKMISQNYKINLLLFALICSIPINYLVDNTILQSDYNLARKASRVVYDDVKKYEVILNKNTDKIFIISQNTTGLDFYILKYNFTPIQTQASSPNIPNIWSIGKPYSDKDQWTVNLSVKEWSKTLKGYTYVYLYKIDDQFISTYGKLFSNSNEINNRTMYQVEKNGDGIMLKTYNNKN